jgi:hypothetical protein
MTENFKELMLYRESFNAKHIRDFNHFKQVQYFMHNTGEIDLIFNLKHTQDNTNLNKCGTREQYVIEIRLRKFCIKENIAMKFYNHEKNICSGFPSRHWR